jgi:hypothetical protein
MPWERDAGDGGDEVYEVIGRSLVRLRVTWRKKRQPPTTPPIATPHSLRITHSTTSIAFVNPRHAIDMLLRPNPLRNASSSVAPAHLVRAARQPADLSSFAMRADDVGQRAYGDQSDSLDG